MLPSYIRKRPFGDESDEGEDIPKRTIANRFFYIRAAVRLFTVVLIYIFCHESYRTAFNYWIKAAFSAGPLTGIDPAFLDMTRSLKHTSVLRPSVSYELNTLDATGIFPEWYGQPAQVGPSPFDYELPPEWQSRARWEFVMSEAYGKEFIAPSLICGTMADCSLAGQTHGEMQELMAAIQDSSSMFSVAAEAPSGSSHSWWKSLHASKSLILVTTGQQRSIERRSGTKHVHIMDECLGLNCTQQLDLKHGQIALSRHGYELSDILAWHKLNERYGEFRMQLFAHLPHSADPEIYYPTKIKPAFGPVILDLDGVLENKRYSEDVPDPAALREATFCVFARSVIGAFAWRALAESRMQRPKTPHDARMGQSDAVWLYNRR